MAIWRYDTTGAEPILRDMPVYDGATLVYGEYVMKGTTDPDSGNDESISLVTGYSATAANSCIDAVGVMNETVDTSSSPSCASAYSTTTGPCYGKVIINPFAIYRTEHSLAAADDQAITSTSSTTLTVGTLADDIDGYFAYFPLTAVGVKGSLRLITAATSGSCTMDSALTTAGTSSDTVVLIQPPNNYAFNLTADGTKCSSSDCQNVKEATNLMVLQTVCDVGAGIEMMRPARHNGMDNLNIVDGNTGPHFYYDVMLKDHLFGVQE